jgi:hypothetical protein
MNVAPINKREALSFIYKWKELVSCNIENDLRL